MQYSRFENHLSHNPPASTMSEDMWEHNLRILHSDYRRALVSTRRGQKDMILENLPFMLSLLLHSHSSIGWNTFGIDNFEGSSVAQDIPIDDFGRRQPGLLRFPSDDDSYDIFGLKINLGYFKSKLSSLNPFGGQNPQQMLMQPNPKDQAVLSPALMIYQLLSPLRGFSVVHAIAGRTSRGFLKLDFAYLPANIRFILETPELAEQRHNFIKCLRKQSQIQLNQQILIVDPWEYFTFRFMYHLTAHDDQNEFAWNDLDLHDHHLWPRGKPKKFRSIFHKLFFEYLFWFEALSTNGGAGWSRSYAGGLGMEYTPQDDTMIDPSDIQFFLKTAEDYLLRPITAFNKGISKQVKNAISREYSASRIDVHPSLTLSRTSHLQFLLLCFGWLKLCSLIRSLMRGRTKNQRRTGVASLLIIFSLASTVMAQGAYSPPPVITIPLDQPVDIRLKDLNAKFAATFKADALKELESVKKKSGKFLYFIGRTLLSFYMNVKGDPVIYDEIAEVAAQTGLDFGDLVVYNYFYEAGCTSIVGQQTNPSPALLFSSNLDFDHSAFIRKYSFQGIYTKNGQAVFIGDGIYGMVGVVRGQRVNTGGNDFAIAINERDVERGQLFVNLLFSQPTEVVYFIRKALQQNSFSDALKMIQNTVLTTAAYYTIGGTNPNDGCVVERSANQVHATTCLSDDTWFLTNYDRNLPDPSDDARRTFAENYLNNLGQENFNTTSLMGLMMTTPILRPPSDTYRTISSIVCANINDPRQTSTWLMYLWDNLSTVTA